MQKTADERMANMQGITMPMHSAQSIIKIIEKSDMPKAQKINTLVSFALDSQYS